MKKNLLSIIGILFIGIGAVVCYFAKWEVADMLGFASTMFGAGLACSNLWGKRDKNAKTGLAILSLALIGAGAFIIGFGGVLSETLMTTVITSVAGFVAIVAGLIVSAVAIEKKSN